MEINVKVIKKGKDLLAIDTGQLLHHINALVQEHSFIITDRKYTKDKEAAWKKENALQVDRAQKLFVAAFVKGKLAGLCEVRDGRGKERYNIFFGMSVGREYRHHGIGDELLSVAMDEGKQRFKARNVYITYHGENKIAREMYEKFGFQEVARLPGYMFHYGKFVDRVIMQLKK
jgi:RimJ/RimL family protein N-acetyltransferase